MEDIKVEDWIVIIGFGLIILIAWIVNKFDKFKLS